MVPYWLYSSPLFTRKLRRYDGQTFLLYVIWYGIGRFVIESLRTDSLLTPILDLRVSQLVAAVSVLAAVVMLIIFRNRTVLTGCGSKKVMELNNIHDEVEVSFDETAPSTIFGDLEVKMDEGDALADEEAKTESENEEAAAPGNSGN